MKYEYSFAQPELVCTDIDILKVTRSAGYRVNRRSGRARHGFIHVVKGSLRNVFTDMTITARAGETVFIPKGSVYSAEYLEDDTEVKIVQFDISAGLLPPSLTAPVILPLPEAGAAISAFFDLPESSAGGNALYCLSCMYALMWRIDESCSRTPAKYRRLRPALNSLNTDSARSAKIAEYADMCGMSEVNFRRLFREYTGVSPVEYRNNVRLKRAQVKLQSGEYTVSEAAESTGFPNTSFFIKLYKQKFGHTPKNK